MFLDEDGNEPIRSIVQTDGKIIALTNTDFLNRDFSDFFTAIEKSSSQYVFYESNAIAEIKQKFRNIPEGSVSALLIGVHSAESMGRPWPNKSLVEPMFSGFRFDENEILWLQDLKTKHKDMAKVFNNKEAHVAIFGCGVRFGQQDAQTKTVAATLAEWTGAEKGSILLPVGYNEKPSLKPKSMLSELPLLGDYFKTADVWQLIPSALLGGPTKTVPDKTGWYRYTWAGGKYKAGEIEYLGTKIDVDQVIPLNAPAKQ